MFVASLRSPLLEISKEREREREREIVRAHVERPSALGVESREAVCTGLQDGAFAKVRKSAFVTKWVR